MSQTVVQNVLFLQELMKSRVIRNTANNEIIGGKKERFIKELTEVETNAANAEQQLHELNEAQIR